MNERMILHVVQHTFRGLPQEPKVFINIADAFAFYAELAVEDWLRAPFRGEEFEDYIKVYEEQLYSTEGGIIENGDVDKENEINYWKIELR